MHAFKEFGDFQEMVAELIDISETIREVICNEEMLPPEDPEEAVKNILNKMMANIPSVYNIDGNIACSVSQYEVGFKTAGALSFGWRVNTSEEGDVVYKARVSLSCNPVIAGKTSVMKAAAVRQYKIVEKTFKERSLDNKRNNS